MNAPKNRFVSIITLLAATLPAPALAGGWFSRAEDCAPGTRHARAEWAPALCRARPLGSLDCDGLGAYAEAERYAANARFLAAYQRPRAGTAPARTPQPLPTMDAPAPAPPPAATTPVFPGPRPR